MRVYLDASVIGGTCDEEYAEGSRSLMDAIEADRVVPIISEVLIGEIRLAPDLVQEQLDRILAAAYEHIGYVEDAYTLRDAYLAASVLPRSASDDALHVAYATIARADVVVSWNYRHLANPARVRAFNGINIANGYGLVLILTPLDVLALLEEDHEA